MNKVQERRMAMLERIDVFLTKHPLAPVIPRAAELATELKGALTAMRQQGGDQLGGMGDFRGGVAERRDQVREIYKDLRELSDVVTSLDPELFPGLAGQFQLPRVRSYQRIMDTARAFLNAVGPVKAALIQRGFAGDFDEQLQAKLTEFEGATDRKNGGLQKQRANTAALALSGEQVRQKAGELDAIMSRALKKADPALALAWKNAVRVYSAPRRTPGTTTAEASATAPTSAATGNPLVGTIPGASTTTVS